MKKVRIGIVGCGLIAKVHAAALRDMDNMELAGVFDPRQESALALASQYPCTRYERYEDMLADSNVDAIALCTPPSLHLSLCKQAAQCGKHVVVEKPLSADLAEVDEMIRFCSEQNVLLCGILQHRFDPLVQVLRELFDNGTFGRILMADARVLWYRDNDYYEKVPWHKLSSNGGVMLNQAIHYMDLMEYLTGGVKRVFGLCRTLCHDMESEDCAVAVLELNGGGIGTLEASTACYPGICAELNIFAEKGSVCIRDESLAFYSHKDGPIGCLDKFLAGASAPSASARPESLSHDSHRAELHNFADAVLGKAPLAVTGEESRRTLALIQAITCSSETSSPRDCMSYTPAKK